MTRTNLSTENLPNNSTRLFELLLFQFSKLIIRNNPRSMIVLLTAWEATCPWYQLNMQEYPFFVILRLGSRSICFLKRVRERGSLVLSSLYHRVGDARVIV